MRRPAVPVFLFLAVLAAPFAAIDAAAAAGDFNGDGYDDLPVSAPSENIDAISDAGAVHVLSGSAGGTTWQGNQLWHQKVPGIPEWPGVEVEFGSALAAGDFDGDGHDDLAVGVPGQAVGGDAHAGAVQILRGKAGPGPGLVASTQLWTQDSPGILNAAEPFDNFGAALAAGDFDGDGRDDLAVGIWREKVGAVDGAGAVQILYGGPGGLSAVDNQFWSQDASGVLNACEGYDGFGQTLATGDFDGDGRDDLVVGTEREDVGAVEDAGLVQVIYGSPAGLSADGDQEWHQNTKGVPGVSHHLDLFGAAVAAGDFDGDGRDDLAVGTPNDEVEADLVAGTVTVLRGFSKGVGTSGAQQWSLNSPGVVNAPEGGEYFGATLAAGDFDGNGRSDLAIGSPHADVSTYRFAGAVYVLYGTAGGLTGAGSDLWGLDDVTDVLEEARFGESLWPADFDGDGHDDLAIGAPRYDVDGADEAGLVVVLASGGSGLVAANARVYSQNTPHILGTAETHDRFGS